MQVNVGTEALSGRGGPAKGGRQGIRRQIKKSLKARVRKARSLYRAWYRRQYFISNAHQDAKRAISQNEDIFLGTAVIAATLIYSYCFVSAQMLINVFEAVYAVNEISSISFSLLLLVTFGVLGVTAAWLLALVGNALAISEMHGFTRKINRSLRSALRQALKTSPLTVLLWSRLGLYVGAPLLIGTPIVAATAIGAHAAHNNFLYSVPALVLLLVVAVSIKRLIIATLAPLVQLFENPSTFKLTLERSRLLLISQGKLFIAGLYGMLAIGAALAYALAYSLFKILVIPISLTMGCAVLILCLYLQTLGVALYNRRRRARS